MKLEELTSTLVEFLRTKLSDPLGKSRTWIYPGYPRVDSTMPRISLINTGGTPTEIGIGDEGQLYDYTYDIDIWVKKGVTVTVGTEKYSGAKLREKISDDVMTAFLNNRKELFGKNILDVKITGPVSFPYDEENQIYRKTMSLIVTVERRKT